jgi:hypothetical protein
MLKFLFQKKNICTSCNEKFRTSEGLLKHAKEIHKQIIRKCNNCGKQFLNEKERLHHMKEEKQREIDYRRHKNLK